MSSLEDDEVQTRDLFADGVELAASLTGNVAAAYLGPAGIVAGPMVEAAVRQAVSAVRGMLSRRENQRAGAALVLMTSDWQERAQRGEQVRGDDFFSADGDLRSDAEELFEGVLREAAASYEERKVPLLSHLYSAVAHDEKVPAADAQYLVRLAADLTYRQFVGLSVVSHVDRYAEHLTMANVSHEEGDSAIDPTLRLEVDDLGDRRIMGVLSGNSVVSPGITWGSSSSVTTAKGGVGVMRLLPAGKVLVALTSADTVVSDADREQWIERLNTMPSYDGYSGPDEDVSDPNYR